MAIQIAKAFGAFVAATASTQNQDLLRELGADQPIDYTRERTEGVRPKFDLVLDGIGRRAWEASFHALRFGGRLVTLTAPIPKQPIGKLKFFASAITGLAAGTLRGLVGGKRLLIIQAKPRGGDLEKINALIEAGKVRPLIEKVFPLEQIAEARSEEHT